LTEGDNYVKYPPFSTSIYFYSSEKSGAELALAIVIPLLLLVLLAIAAVFVYRRWKKKKQRKGYEATDEGMSMNPVTAQPVS